ncbi:MAG TPA: cytochrome c [Candidatus Binataceae bacterium]|nr:cytochrome c [Candidatus Binataceae bacterium]
MPSSIRWFILGIGATFVGLIVGGYLFVTMGGISMETTAHPLPFEKMVAKMALHASFGNAAQDKSPIAPDDTNMLAGAKLFTKHCAVCHSTPGQEHSAIAKGMFPPPPLLFKHGAMVTDDPEGITYWKVTHGIRLSGMPGFKDTLTDTERWQLTMLVKHADALSPPVLAALAPPAPM